MPQVDFRKALSFRSDPSGPVTSDVTGQEHLVAARPSPEKPGENERAGLGSAGLMNLLFSLLALAGGLFFAFCFYNGADLMHAMLAWPAELADPRPSPATEIAQIVLPRASAKKTSSAATNSVKERHNTEREPFGPRVGSLDRPRFNAPNRLSDGGNGNSGFRPSLPSSGARTAQSTGVPRGADALSQIFDRDVADLEQARVLDTKRTIVVVRTAPSRATRARVAASLKTAKQQTANARAAIAVAKGAERNARSTGVAAINPVHSSTNSKIGNVGRPRIEVGNGLSHSGVTGLGGAAGSRGIGGRVGGLSRGLGGGGRH